MLNWKFLLALILASLAGTGCSVVGVKVKNPLTARAEVRRVAAGMSESEAIRLVEQAAKASVSDEAKLSLWLKVAELTQKAPEGSSDHKVNQLATAEIVKVMKQGQFAPVRLADGYTLSLVENGKNTLDPRTADELLLAESIRIRGLRTRTVQEGAGLSYVVRFAPKSPALKGQPGIPPRAGICEPVTAVVHFEGKNRRLAFYRTLKSDEAFVGGRKVKLAADFSAPLAYMISKGENRLLSLRAMFRTDANMHYSGLYQFSTYDPTKIPVVFVHGLMSRPETWTPAVNALLADKRIRERYQFWFFMYPTGLSVWASVAKLRSEIDRFRTTLNASHQNRNFDHMVLAGHSMGGLISGLQIRTGGKLLWRQFLTTPPQELKISQKLKEHIIRIVEFSPRPEIARVVFFATPHRGSDLAVNPIANFASRLIRLPLKFLRTDMRDMQEFLHEDVRELFLAPVNSLVFLRSHSPLLTAILKLPMRPHVPFHSIIGDRRRGDTPHSSDGIVPYWSSHLEGAASEKIVPSGHGTNENPEGIEEFHRILRLHLACY